MKYTLLMRVLPSRLCLRDSCYGSEQNDCFSGLSQMNKGIRHGILASTNAVVDQLLKRIALIVWHAQLVHGRARSS
jgi:hypothetical protein